MTGDRASEPLWVVEGGGKLRNGLYVRETAMYDDRIVVEVFASRPLGADDLAECGSTAETVFRQALLGGNHHLGSLRDVLLVDQSQRREEAHERDRGRHVERPLEAAGERGGLRITGLEESLPVARVDR